MKNLNIRYISAKNFLPFGPEGIELHLDKYKNIVLIRGENKDAKAIESDDYGKLNINSNGSGKSSIQEVIVFGLFGKTIKPIGVNQVVHNKIGKDCYVEVIFGDYRIVRTRMGDGNKNKSSLRFWYSEKGIWDKDSELTEGSLAATQAAIDSKLGLSYDAFINISIFTDDQRLCFLECDNPKKKEIVENLLSLGEYREWHEQAKALRKEIKNKIDSKSKEFELLLSNKDNSQSRLELSNKKHLTWIENKKNEIVSLEKKIVAKELELSTTDNGAALILYQEAQNSIITINQKLFDLETSKEAISKNIEIAKEKEQEQKAEALVLTNKYNEYSSQAKSKLEDRKKKEEEIKNLRSNTPGTKCGKCRSLVEQKNIEDYIKELEVDINHINIEIKSLVDSAKEIGKKSEELKPKQSKLALLISQINNKISSIDSEMRNYRNQLTAASQVREPKADSSELLLEQQILELKRQLNVLKSELDGKSPFQEIIDNDKLELEKIILDVESKKKEVEELEKELPYYDYWIFGFGDHGIRKWVVDGIIPELNNRINYWLQFLIDNMITLKFDNELIETIERNPVDGDPYVYHAMSGGQRRRLNLAISQAFAHIMELSSESTPSVVFLDEVSTNVDVGGNISIYNMILELAQEKQVFITTHDPNLLQMLEGCDLIDLVHENGFTTLR